MKKNRYTKQFNIPFTGLKVGDHEFDFEINNEFLKHFEIDDIVSIDVKAVLILTKKDMLLVLNLSLDGSLQLTCDRCGDEFKQGFNCSDSMVVKFGQETMMEDEFMILSPSESEVDISHFLYELIVLNIPAKKLHPEGLCNEDALKRLSQLEIKEEPKDPRWNTLNQIQSLN